MSVVKITEIGAGSPKSFEDAHNPLVPGSSPGGPTNEIMGLESYGGRPRDISPLTSA
jgi:hypothetical protein